MFFTCCSTEEASEAHLNLETHSFLEQKGDADEEVPATVTIQSEPAKDAESPAKEVAEVAAASAVEAKEGKTVAAQEPAAPQAAAPAGPPAGQVYSVDLEKLGGKFGAMLDLHVKDYAIVSSISSGGAIEKWNSSCEPDQVIQVGDRLLSVDGTGGDNPNLLAKISNSTSSLKVQLRRPTEITVSLPAAADGKKVGLRLPVTTEVENMLGCEVMCIVPDSRMSAWNDKADSTQVIKVNDRVFKVDGERVDGQAVQQALKAKASSALQLTFISWQ
eukprot:TRINITY_DN80419_c0_g1_i1.p1 TRINITY_DN80419_c0_g1~~TRINITY_DN80419_c0_g1_i1.p1  ORF type:complete len:294 (-),score=68.62 TRINITY_DN80419_c0_g1_i1:74-895(-)